MGHKHFGNLYHLKNIVYVRLSSYEINPFHNFVSTTLRHWKRDFWGWGIYFVPAYFAAHGTIHILDSIADRNSRKNPADFANDE